MAADIILIDPFSPAPAFARCCEVIRSGGIVAFPTETFYGLGVDPKNESAVQRLFAIKGRRPDQPILILLNNPEPVGDWALEVTPSASRLMERFWPGPLTLVFKAQRGVLPALTGGTGTIGLRVPGVVLIRQLLAAVGGALTGTSANISGTRSPRTATDTAAVFGEAVDLILDGGTTPGGRPSTVVNTIAEPLRLIREGVVPAKDIRALVHLAPERG